MAQRAFILADGENLTFRYQAMAKEGRVCIKDADGIYHIPDTLIWSSRFLTSLAVHVVRVAYYSSYVGDEDKLKELSGEIFSIQHYCWVNNLEESMGRICPYLYKKSRREEKTKRVDVNITIDALRHTYNNSLDVLILMSGDGDYLPLVQEVMRQGKKVWIAAFSSGLCDELITAGDSFFLLDSLFFEKPQPEKKDNT